MWNLKYNRNEFIYKTETYLQIKTGAYQWREGRGEQDKVED